MGPSTLASKQGQPRPQGPPSLPCAPGLSSRRSPRAEGACARGIGDESSKQPHPGGNVNVHLPSALKCFPWGNKDGLTLHDNWGTPGLFSILPTPSPCCLEKIFFCLRSRGILSMTGLRKVTWEEGPMGGNPPPPLGGGEALRSTGMHTLMFWGFQSLWHHIQNSILRECNLFGVTSSRVLISPSVVPDQQHHLGTCQKCRFLGPHLDPLNQKCKGGAPQSVFQQALQRMWGSPQSS